MNQTILIARHGNREDFVDLNWLKTAPRPFDPGLSPDGFEQAQKLADYLKSESINHLFSSPFLRTIQTANVIAETLDLPIKLEAGLGEFMIFPGIKFIPEILPINILVEQFPRIDPAYQSQIIPQHPETVRNFCQRSRQTIQTLSNQVSGNILLVTHAAPLVEMTQALLPHKTQLHSELCCLMKLVKIEENWQLELNGVTFYLDKASINPILKEIQVIKRYLLHKWILIQRQK